MNVISFECRNCGASLTIPPNAIIVTCNHCKGQHKITYSEGNITAELTRRTDEYEKYSYKLNLKTVHQTKADEMKLRLHNIDLGLNLLQNIRKSENGAQKKGAVKQAVEVAVKGYGETHRDKVKSYFELSSGLTLTDTASKVGCFGIIVFMIIFTVIMSFLPKPRSIDSIAGHVVTTMLVLGIGMVVLIVIVRLTNKFQSKVEVEQAKQELDKTENEIKSKLCALIQQEQTGTAQKQLEASDTVAEICNSTAQKKGGDNKTYSVSVGDIFEGIVVETKDFGVFVQLQAGGVEGLCHISEFSASFVKNIYDVCKVGDVIPVKVLSIDESGRLKLSRKAALAELERKGNQ